MGISIERVLTDKEEIAEAYRKYDKAVNGCGERITATFSRRGRTTIDIVNWHPELGIWSYFDPKRTKNRYWCAYGIENPKNNRNMNITCEMNMLFINNNRRVAAFFARHSSNKTLLLHSGKFGSRNGICKEAFFEFYKDAPLIDIIWPDRIITESIFIGILEEPDFLDRIAGFVKVVDRFKKWVVG